MIPSEQEQFINTENMIVVFMIYLFHYYFFLRCSREIKYFCVSKNIIPQNKMNEYAIVIFIAPLLTKHIIWIRIGMTMNVCRIIYIAIYI